MKEAASHEGMPYGAICISPRILANAGLLRGKRATGWNGDGELQEIFSSQNVTYEQSAVVTDGRVITADGPMSAGEFGQAIVDLMKSN